MNGNDIKLAETADNFGSNVIVYSSDQLAGSPPFLLFLKTYTELLEKKFGSPYASWGDSNRSKVVYCVNDNNQILGGIAYEYRPLLQEGWILLSFTDPEHRGKGINKIMHNYFEQLIKEAGGKSISSHVHINNLPRLRSAQKVGFIPQYYRMQKLI